MLTRSIGSSRRCPLTWKKEEHIYNEISFCGQVVALKCQKVVVDGLCEFTDNWSPVDSMLGDPATPWLNVPSFTYYDHDATEFLPAMIHIEVSPPKVEIPMLCGLAFASPVDAQANATAASSTSVVPALVVGASPWAASSVHSAPSECPSSASAKPEINDGNKATNNLQAAVAMSPVKMNVPATLAAALFSPIAGEKGARVVRLPGVRPPMGGSSASCKAEALRARLVLRDAPKAKDDDEKKTSE